MTNSSFSVNKKLVIESPEPSKALPVSHQEWFILKTKVEFFRKKKSFVDSCGWKDIGMVFLGIALTTAVTVWLPGNPSSSYKTIAWVIVAAAIFLTASCRRNFAGIVNTSPKTGAASARTLFMRCGFYSFANFARKVFWKSASFVARA